MGVRVAITVIGTTVAVFGGMYVAWRVKTFFVDPFEGLGDKIKKPFEGLGDKIKKPFDGLGDKIKDAFKF